MNNFKIYAINLEKDKERLAFMEKQFLDLGLNFERVPAIYGKDLLQYEIEKYYDKDKSIKLNGKELTLGELGCAISHQNVYKKFLNDKKENVNLKYCVVLEDDVSLTENFKEILQKVIRENDIPNFDEGKIWDYLLFDYVKPGLSFARSWLKSIPVAFRLKNNFFDKTKFVFVSFLKFIAILIFSFFEGFRNFYYKKIAKKGKVVRFYRSLYLAGCYVVSTYGIKKILSISEKIIYPADIF
jgi:GR25 family glycosyltransferase involved in LPS biosynthesis